MLKKSIFSPAQPRRAETRLFPCSVLASLKASTYRTEYAFGLSLAAALLDGLFEHPASHFDPSGNLCSVVFPMAKNSFSTAC
jgi:hypothetical protein